MHPATAVKLLALVGGDGPIADPFCGGGTVLVEAQRAGRPTIGVDANPLAILVAAAKTWTPPAARLAELRRVGVDLAASALDEGKAARRAGFSPRPRRVPPRTDPDRRNRMLKEWFAPHVRAEIEFLSSAIDGVGDKDAELAERLRVPLSAILHKVSFRTSDTDPRKTERKVGRGFAARLFRDRVDQLCDGLRRTRPPRPAAAGPGPPRRRPRPRPRRHRRRLARRRHHVAALWRHLRLRRPAPPAHGLPRPVVGRARQARRSARGAASRDAGKRQAVQGGTRPARLVHIAGPLAPRRRPRRHHPRRLLAADRPPSSPTTSSPTPAPTASPSPPPGPAQERRPLGAAELSAFRRRHKGKDGSSCSPACSCSSISAARWRSGLDHAEVGVAGVLGHLPQLVGDVGRHRAAAGGVGVDRS